ncbi:MAG TPA: Sec-independent protein translocase subunit TatA [Mycobacteriales bacterium]|nr:Sec-independent protein translocase subunit TatA [Mycobacteriales bacterium]
MVRDVFAPWHIILLVAVFVMLFGAKKLPEGARALGQSLHIFKREIRGLADDDASASPSAAPGAQPAAIPAAPPAAAPSADAGTGLAGAGNDPVAPNAETTPTR